MAEDDRIIVGDAAARRTAIDPTRTAQEFKRRFGDPTSLRLGGAVRSSQALMADLLGWVIELSITRPGGDPVEMEWLSSVPSLGPPPG